MHPSAHIVHISTFFKVDEIRSVSYYAKGFKIEILKYSFLRDCRDYPVLYRN